MARAERPLPIWEERALPTLQLDDIQNPTDGPYSIRSQRGNPDYYIEFYAWLEESKTDLQGDLHESHHDMPALLAVRGIDLHAINQAVAGMVNVPVYDTKRIITVQEARALRTYQELEASGTFDFSLEEEADYFETQVHSFFEAQLNFVQINADHIRTAEASEVADTVAYSLGHAALGNTVDILLLGSPEWDDYKYWYGYEWVYNGEYYGDFIRRAAAYKIAAEVRAHTGFSANGRMEKTHPLLRTYLHPDGSHHPYALLSLSLDVLNSAAGYSHGVPGLYEPLFAFARDARDGAAREELADMVHEATDGRLTLEELERFDLHANPLAVLRRIEEACEMDVSARPSSLFE
ncbi:MAG: hypothetical protein JWL85_833 [Candidatus Saccharibacteria bacterium]|nr:hypothetical protein [Candidatus Saccharibacteria bacterium]